MTTVNGLFTSNRSHLEYMKNTLIEVHMKTCMEDAARKIFELEGPTQLREEIHGVMDDILQSAKILCRVKKAGFFMFKPGGEFLIVCQTVNTADDDNMFLSSEMKRFNSFKQEMEERRKQADQRRGGQNNKGYSNRYNGNWSNNSRQGKDLQ